MMRNFEKPFCEVVRFGSSVMTASACGCFDGEDDWGTVCTGDIASCECEINTIAGTANCCDKYQP